MPIYTTNKSVIKNLYISPISEQIHTIDIDYDVDNMSVSFRYAFSFDDVTYSEWYDSVSMLINNIELTNITYENIYVRIQLETVKNSSEYGYLDLNSISVNNVQTVIQSVETVQQTNNILRNVLNEDLYKPYRDLEDAHELNRKMSYAVSKIFSHKCTYFRTEPDNETKSITFKSYKLSNVVEAKEMELLIVNNEIPDNRTNFSEWDYDFFDQLECHIVIQVFDEVFPGSIPNADDYLYLPLTDRIYQVNTVNEVKQFMHKSTYYQLVLTKWEDRADVNDTLPNGTNMTDQLPDLEYAEDFGFEDLETEVENATKSYNDEEPTNNIIDDSISSEGVTFVKFMFDYTDVVNYELVQTYKFATDNEFAVSMWFKYERNNINLFSIVNELNDKVFELSINRFNNAVLNYYKDMHSSELIANGSKLQPNTKYGLVLNYVYNEKGTYLTLTIVDETFEIVQQNFTKVFDKIVMTDRIDFNGNYVFGNLRVRKSMIQSNMIADVLKDMLPSSEEYYVLRNATPSIKGHQFKV